MSITLIRASEQYLKVTPAALYAKPITISAWIKTDDADNFQGIVSITDNSDEFLQLQARMAIGGDPLGAMEYNVAWKYAESSTPITTGNWHHVCGVFKNATSRTAYLDGGGKVTNTDNQSVNFDAITMILIGVHKTVGGAYFSGKIASVAIWVSELSDADVLLLANGTSPTEVDPVYLSKYWPLVADGESGLEGGATLVGFNDPVYDSSDNPAVLFNYPQQNIATIKRVVVAGNNEIWYENV